VGILTITIKITMIKESPAGAYPWEAEKTPV